MEIFIALLILIIYNLYQISSYKIERISLTSKKLKKSLRLVQITDFHSSRFINLNRLARDISKVDPDIIVLTGDIIDGRKRSLKEALNLVSKLSDLAIDSYFVMGNHEYRNPKLDLFIDSLRAQGIKILDNELVKIGEGAINLAGINFGLDREDYDELISFMDEDSYNILLSHSPKYPIEYGLNREDLVLSGHTHGGQVRLPFLGAVLSPSEGFFPEYDKGLYEIGKTVLYIDSGLGSSLLPLRILNRVQISIIDID